MVDDTETRVCDDTKRLHAQAASELLQRCWISAEHSLPPLDLICWLNTDRGVIPGARVCSGKGWLWAEISGVSNPWIADGEWKSDSLEEDDIKVLDWMPFPLPPSNVTFTDPIEE